MHKICNYSGWKVAKGRSDEFADEIVIADFDKAHKHKLAYGRDCGIFGTEAYDAIYIRSWLSRRATPGDTTRAGSSAPRNSVGTGPS